jgi:hypothetical protein
LQNLNLTVLSWRNSSNDIDDNVDDKNNNDFNDDNNYDYDYKNGNNNKTNKARTLTVSPARRIRTASQLKVRVDEVYQTLDLIHKISYKTRIIDRECVMAKSTNSTSPLELHRNAPQLHKV